MSEANQWRVGVVTDVAEVNPSVSVAGLQNDAEVSFLSMPDVGENGKVINPQVRELGEVKSGFTRFEDNDVLFAKITPCMQNGKGAFATNLKSGIGFGSTEFHVLRANEDGDAEFIYHVSLSPELRTKAIAFFSGSAGQQRVSKDFFDRYELDLPPKPEQRKIARILTTLDNLIEKTEALIAKYQSIKQGMMHDLFTRGVDESARLRPTHEQAPDLYKQSELGWIPKEWDITTVGAELNAIEAGKSPNCPDQPAPYGEWGVLKVSAVQPDGFRSEENKIIVDKVHINPAYDCLLYTSPSPRDQRGSRMPSSA